MAQHDMDVSNQTFTATRADINAALQALASNNSGATAPATTFAYQWWADTTSGILKQRNAANSAWVNVLNLATGVPTGTAASGANGDITSLTALTAGGLPDNSVLTADIANAQITPAKLSQPMTIGTTVNTTSGSAIDFTSLPNWVRRITVMLNGVSTTGTAFTLLQLGAGAAPLTTGYVSYASIGTTVFNSTSGFIVYPGAVAASSVYATIVLVHMGGNIWSVSGTACPTTTTAAAPSVGTLSLGGTLDRIRLSTTDTFDLGSVNILYE